MQSAVEPPGRRLLLSGALDLETAAELEALVLALSADGTDVVMLDLRKLDVIDPLGVRAVVLAYAVCESDGLDFQLVPGSPQVQRVFSCCGTIDLLPFTAANRRRTLTQARAVEWKGAGDEQ
ncbi:MAG TPA: STAS domain-containing protein [Solirubrobacteraceae bacterium]|nr:STAS domain-containing protein [Solirubrobacteraceae bacterium]